MSFVGHPIVDALADAPARDDARKQLDVYGDAPVIGLLPGSRRHEITRVMPVMRRAAELILARHPDARFLVAQAPTVDRAALETTGAAGQAFSIVSAGTYAVMRAADLLLVTSGTATLEAALLGTPMVVCYRLSRLSELLFRPLVRIPWISLANITLGRAVVPELYQRALSAESLAREALALLESPAALATQREASASWPASSASRPRRRSGRAPVAAAGGVGSALAARMLPLMAALACARSA